MFCLTFPFYHLGEFIVPWSAFPWSSPHSLLISITLDYSCLFIYLPKAVSSSGTCFVIYLSLGSWHLLQSRSSINAWNCWVIDVRLMFLIEVIFLKRACLKKLQIEGGVSCGLNIGNVDCRLNWFTHGCPNSNPWLVLEIISSAFPIYLMVMGDGVIVLVCSYFLVLPPRDHGVCWWSL